MPSTNSQDFIRMADNDMRLCLSLERDFPDEYAVLGAMYHSQQAVEKQLKSIILLNGEEPPFIHDIRKLMQRCEPYTVLPAGLDSIADTLTLWESKSRYDPYTVFSRNVYDAAKSIYSELHGTIEDILKNFQTEDYISDFKLIVDLFEKSRKNIMYGDWSIIPSSDPDCDDFDILYQSGLMFSIKCGKVGVVSDVFNDIETGSMIDYLCDKFDLTLDNGQGKNAGR